IIDCLLEGNPNVIQELKQGNYESTRKEMNLSSYYSKVLGCITMTEVCRMPIKEIKRLMEFFLGELNPESQEFKNLAHILPEKSEKLVEDKNSVKEKGYNKIKKGD
ncbi:MAG: hypothetical protein K2I72_00545, partial [Bacilli bacterium]|nr:hypothetical protein [Bacilli bacterium]